MNTSNVQTGIEFFKSGNQAEALRVFIEVLKREPNNEVGWLWLAACVEEAEERKYCFHKALAINPGNASVQEALAALEPETRPLVQPIPDVEEDERKNVEGALKICKAALDGRNYTEALQYANTILEIDPQNFSGWINKAVATYWLTTEANNQFDEAMGYLDTAEKIAGDDPLIEATRKRLMEGQCGWYTHLGDQADDLAGKIMDKYAATHKGASGYSEAKKRCREHAIKAMNYYLLASNYDPNDLTPVYKMKYLAEFGSWIHWPAEVRKKIAALESAEQINRVSKLLTRLKKQLQEIQARLANLEKEKGLLAGMKRQGAKRNLASLKRQIANCEKAINPQ